MSYNNYHRKAFLLLLWLWNKISSIFLQGTHIWKTIKHLGSGVWRVCIYWLANI